MTLVSSLPTGGDWWRAIGPSVDAETTLRGRLGMACGGAARWMKDLPAGVVRTFGVKRLALGVLALAASGCGDDGARPRENGASTAQLARQVSEPEHAS